MPTTVTQQPPRSADANLDFLCTEPGNVQTTVKTDQIFRQLLLTIFNTRLKLLTGSGSPNTVVSADPGWVYLDVAAGTFYAKQTGLGTNTGWIVIGGGGGGGQPLGFLTGSGAPVAPPANQLIFWEYLNTDDYTTHWWNPGDLGWH